MINQKTKIITALILCIEFGFPTFCTGAQNEILRNYSQGQSVPFPEVSKFILQNPIEALTILGPTLTNGTAEQQTLLLTSFEQTNISCSQINDQLSSLIRSPYWPVRAAAVKFIRFKNCADHTQGIRDQFPLEKEPTVKAMAAMALAKFGNAADADLIKNLNCPPNDLTCEVQKQAALRRLQQPHDISVIKEGLQNKNESIQRAALQCFEDTVDPEIRATIESNHSFPLSLQWFRDTTVERLKINQLPAHEKEQALWNVLDSENPVLVDWAAQTLLNTSSDLSTRQKLVTTFEKSLKKAIDTPADHHHSGQTETEHDMDPSIMKFEKVTNSPQSSALLGALVTRGILTREELIQKIQQTEMK